jgi:hypothetical protein
MATKPSLLQVTVPLTIAVPGSAPTLPLRVEGQLNLEGGWSDIDIEDQVTARAYLTDLSCATAGAGLGVVRRARSQFEQDGRLQATKVVIAGNQVQVAGAAIQDGKRRVVATPERVEEIGAIRIGCKGVSTVAAPHVESPSRRWLPRYRGCR